MSSKKNKSSSPIVYSTDPDFKSEQESNDVETLPAAQQPLKIKLDTKHRAGKIVTLIIGFVGNEKDIEELGKKLKNHCGTGGAVKDGEIIIQGDHKEKICIWLQKNGYTRSKQL